MNHHLFIYFFNHKDSVLDFDGQLLDPAIVSAQPMKPVQTVDLQQLACASCEYAALYPHWLLQKVMGGI